MTQTPKPRWWLLAAILIVALVVTILARSRTDEAATQMMGTLSIGRLTAVLVLIDSLSGFRSRRRSAPRSTSKPGPASGRPTPAPAAGWR